MTISIADRNSADLLTRIWRPLSDFLFPVGCLIIVTNVYIMLLSRIPIDASVLPLLGIVVPVMTARGRRGRLLCRATHQRDDIRIDVMANKEANGNGRRLIDWRLSVGNIIAILGMIIGGLSMWFGLGERVTVLETNLSMQVANIMQMSGRLQWVEGRAEDVRERLKGIEVTQQQQNETLKRILQAVER